MAPNPRVAKAFRAMRQIGIAEEICKPVLKNLLKLYEKNWELIEEENYRALADAIFDAQDSEAAEKKKKLDNPAMEVDSEEEAQVHEEEPERPLKRLRLRHQEAQAASSLVNSSSRGHHQTESQIVSAFPESNFENSSKKQPVSPQLLGRNKGKQPISSNALLEHERSSTQQARAAERTQPGVMKRIESDSTTPGRLKDEGKEPLLPQEKTPISAKPSIGVRFKEPKLEPGVNHSPKNKALALIRPKDEPVTDDMPCSEVPLAVIYPDSFPKGNSANGHGSVREAGGAELPRSKSCVEKDRTDEISDSSEKENTSELANISDESTANLEIASSLSGEVKLSLICNSAFGETPSSDSLLKALEDKCLRSYKILDPNFSVKNLLKDVCELFSELRSHSTNQPQVAINVTPPIDLLKKSCAADVGSKGMPSCALNGSTATHADDTEILRLPPPCNGVDDIAKPIDQNGLDDISQTVEQNGVDDSAPVEQNRVSDMAVDHNENELETELNSADDSAPVERNEVSKLAADNNENELETELNGVDESTPVEQNGVSEVAVDNNDNELETELNGVDDSAPVEQNGVSEVAVDNNENELETELNGVEASSPVEQYGVSDMVVDNNENELETELNEDERASCRSFVVVQTEQSQSAPVLDDIAKGQERVMISLVNEVNNVCPPSFHYIPQNAVFQNAYVSFSLAHIGDDNCCSTCFDDCLSSSTPCACALQSGGEYAYTSDGLVREELLEECVSMNRNPRKNCLAYCIDCPLERSKNEEIIEPCKGHLMRKFIKECWWKCGCNKQCGNRVVQRGINRNLQVFMTLEGKGWGLRSLEDLPKGAFVCEYVGEVLTSVELYDRISRSSNKDEHAYPVLLDADWTSESVLKDEEARCLDATHFGNVARFINHRCCDSALVGIPVEVETPNRHYYHLAFFTTRKVKALEELTWDYGIDFDDHEHPVKAFQCRCGSKFCRNIKRASRTRSEHS